MGRQAAAANLGQAIGSVLTGSSFALSDALPFWIGFAVLLASGLAVVLEQRRVARS
jgi:hypothetical protein